MGKLLQLIHDKLNSFTYILTSYLRAVFGVSIMKKLEFISPYKLGASNPNDSYLFPYKYPDKLGVNKGEVFVLKIFDKRNFLNNLVRIGIL